MNTILFRLYRAARFLSLGTAGGLLLAAALLVWNQDYLILPASIEPRAFPAPPEVEQVMLETEDREQVRVWHLREAKLGMHPFAAGRVLLVLHGNGDTVESSLNSQKFFSALGFSTYAVDYRGTGGSSGKPSEAGLYRDVEAAWKFVRQRHPTSAITLFGRSFGTGLASYLAEKYAARSLILISPYLSIPKIVRDRGVLSLLTPFLRYDIPAHSFVRRLKNACVIAAHGGKDSIIEVHHTEELMANSEEHTTLEKIIIPEADHDSIMALAEDRMLKALESCFQDQA